MKQRGKRIRPSGKDLVFHFTIASLLPVFLLVVGLFHVKTIQQINWQDFNLSQADKIDIPYLIISFSVAILICLLVAFVFKRVRYDTVKQLYHRQKLAKMILENKWYESEQVKTEGFFKDSAGRTKEKITYFPKMYYRLKNGLIQIAMLGTVVQAAGLVDDTVNVANEYSRYPLENYQLDFYVDNSWGWLPWNWSDGIGKQVMYGLYAITNFIWTISLYVSNATGYLVQEAYSLDFISATADSIGKNMQTLAGVSANGFSTEGFPFMWNST